MAEQPSADLGEPPSVAALSVAETGPKQATEQSIDPWSVSAGTDEHGNAKSFDYKAISKQWDTKLIDQEFLDRFEKVTGHKPHRWLRRGLFFSHRDFNDILTCHEKGEAFMLYTGRGPSSGSMHVGHTVPFEFTKWLQDVFDVPLVIMLTDDEKFLFKDNLGIEEVREYARENARDIISVGFDLRKTFIYMDTEYIGGHFYQNALQFSRGVTFNQVRGAFGFDQSTNIGRVFFPALQCIAAYPTSYPTLFGDDPTGKRNLNFMTAGIRCLIPCAIDQDPYFRLVRDNSNRMEPPLHKPALIHSKFLTGLKGPGGKMSSSDADSAIFISDTPNDIARKIKKKAFSGGQEDLEDHRRLGGNPDVDVAYQYLSYFDDDDEKLEKLAAGYRSGEILTSEMKKECITVLQEYVQGYQTRRNEVTDELLDTYMTPRRLHFSGDPKKNEAKVEAERQQRQKLEDIKNGKGKKIKKEKAPKKQGTVDQKNQKKVTKEEQTKEDAEKLATGSSEKEVLEK